MIMPPFSIPFLKKRSLYLSQTTALVAAMVTPPTTARTVLYDTFFRTIVPTGIFNKLNVLFVFSAHTQQAALLNLINPGGAIPSLVNTVNFSVDHGFTSDGTAGYINSGFAGNATFTGGGWSQNDCCMGFSLYAAGNGTSAAGLVASGNITLHSTFGSNMTARINSATSSVDANTTGVGVFHANRISTAPALTNYVNGASIGPSHNATSIALSSAVLCLLRSGSSAVYSTDSMCAFWIGGSLSISQVSIMNTALRGLMNGITPGLVA